MRQSSRAAKGQGHHPFTRVYPSRVRVKALKGAQLGPIGGKGAGEGKGKGESRPKGAGNSRRAMEAARRAGRKLILTVTKLGPGVPKLGPLGPRGILSTRRH